MAQDRKASADDVRDSLKDAIRLAAAEVSAAHHAYAGKPSLDHLRTMQVATDRLSALHEELKAYDDARDPEAMRRADANPRRSRTAWPVGKPYEESRPKRRAPRPPKPDEPVAPPPPTERPTTLKDRIVAGKRVSWWVGIDRTTLDRAAQTLKELPPMKTSQAASKPAVKHAVQVQNDAKRDAKKRGEAASRTLADRLRPTAGEFIGVPSADAFDQD